MSLLDILKNKKKTIPGTRKVEIDKEHVKKNIDKFQNIISY